MDPLDRALFRLLGKSRWELLRVATDSANRYERIIARLYLRMADADKGDLSFRTAKNGKVYPINEETGTIAAGPMKGVKVGKGESTAASKVGAKKEYPKPEHPEPGTRTSEPPLDKKGKPFRHTRLNLHHQEYGQVMHEITSNYDMYEGKSVFFHETYIENGDDEGYHVYWVENHGKDDYNIFERDPQ